MALSQRTESELLWPPRPPISMLGSCAVELAEFFALGRNADGKRCDFVFQGGAFPVKTLAQVPRRRHE